MKNKKIVTILLTMALSASLFAGCGNKAGGDSTGTGNETGSTAQQTAESGNADQNTDQKEGTGAAGASSSAQELSETKETAAQEPASVDFAQYEWVQGELDCYNHDDNYVSFAYPSSFSVRQTNESGTQSVTYSSGADLGEGKYYILVEFIQLGHGPNYDSLNGSIEGGFQERELAGKTLYFGEVSESYKASVGQSDSKDHVFQYLLEYGDGLESRIWIMVVDQEEDGSFRKTFEESLSFEKPAAN